MVAGTTATRTARTFTKPAYKPHVRLLDAGKGFYTVQSERYTYLLYAVDVAQGTCECESGQRGFKGVKRLCGVCKHLSHLPPIPRPPHGLPGRHTPTPRHQRGGGGERGPDARLHPRTAGLR